MLCVFHLLHFTFSVPHETFYNVFPEWDPFFAVASYRLSIESRRRRRGRGLSQQPSAVERRNERTESVKWSSSSFIISRNIINLVVFHLFPHQRWILFSSSGCLSERSRNCIDGEDGKLSAPLNKRTSNHIVCVFAFFVSPNIQRTSCDV